MVGFSVVVVVVVVGGGGGGWSVATNNNCSKNRQHLLKTLKLQMGGGWQAANHVPGS